MRIARVILIALALLCGADARAGDPAPRRWVRGDFHAHTRWSYDCNDPVRSVVERARRRGLDFVWLTDHDTLAQAQDPETRGVQGIEVHCGSEWTSACHALVLGAGAPLPLPRGVPAADLPGWVQATIDRARAAGAVVSLNHPAEARFPWLFDVRGADAVEVWNGAWAVSNAGLRALSPAALERAAAAAGVTPSALIARVARAPGSGNDQALLYWEELLERGERPAALGGTDDHGWYEQAGPATWVLAASAREADILRAVRERRTVVTARSAGPFVVLEADRDGSGRFEAAIGDALAAGHPATLRARVTGGRGCVVQILRRRHLVAEVAIDDDAAERTLTFDDTPRAGDWYRADLYRPVSGLADALDRSWRWPRFARAAITGAIFVDP